MNKKTKNEELDRLTIDEFKNADKTPLVLILDDIRSLNNIGSMFRTADAFRLEKIYLCGITAQPPHRDIRKTALGSTESVDWEYRENAVELTRDLANGGYKILVLEQADKKTYLNDFKLIEKEKVALIVGNEVKGVSQELVDAADQVLEIPQSGTKHSLNVSVSCGIAVWQILMSMNKLK